MRTALIWVPRGCVARRVPGGSDFGNRFRLAFRH